MFTRKICTKSYWLNIYHLPVCDKLYFSKMAAVRLSIPHALLKCDTDTPPMKSINVILYPSTWAGLILVNGMLYDFQGKVIKLLLSPLMNACSWTPLCCEKVQVTRRRHICRFWPTVPADVSDDSQVSSTRYEWGNLCHDSSRSHYLIAITRPEKKLHTICPVKHYNHEC